MWAPGPRVYDYLPARKTLTAFAVMTLILVLVTIAICIWCAMNYGHGLKNHTVKHNRNDSVTDSVHKQEYYMEPYNSPGPGAPSQAYGIRPPGGSRMEID
jgi:amino acid transporter